MKSTHPIGKAFTDYLMERKIDILDVQEFKNVSGLGIIGKIDNEKVFVGNSKMLEEYGIKNEHQNTEKSLSEKGNSIVYIARGKEILGIVGVNDIVRDEAKEIIQELAKYEVDTVMLTGDNEDTANIIAKDIGIINVVANVLPAEKTDVIKELKSNGKFVMMCGDGINDSPALATANIGVSVNSGTDIAMDSSDVILTNNNLRSVIRLISISKRTVRNIKQNLFWAFFYNVLMIPVAIGVLKPLGISINPMIASLAMVLSSITVIFNALRLRNVS